MRAQSRNIVMIDVSRFKTVSEPQHKGRSDTPNRHIAQPADTIQRSRRV